ncbi:MAG: hypothetical protein CM15mP79_1280 [Methanobacteriota archaeon]|nr:MAG: hypothetical protein CM15mP79_1280 [Euryarchaeota archaeon]
MTVDNNVNYGDFTIMRFAHGTSSVCGATSPTC